jgi:NAD(P)-dependent dehydrogenase (short-subunit alcohol dehydrogenase family)
VNTASEAGIRGSAAGAAYTASKHGIVGLTRSLAVMYRNRGIRANAIAPGGTATGMIPDIDGSAHGPRALGPYMGNVGRVSRPEEQAAAIAFLASDAASNVNGVILPVDNGWPAV